MYNKISDINTFRKSLGWAYSDFKWLTGKQVKLANKKRDRLLNSLSNKVNYSFLQSKIHTGQLSPGCLICGQGYWSCIRINHRCTANCFYCVQDRKIKKELPPYFLEDLKLNASEYADFLAKLNFRGVGFTGGEPFLVFEKLLKYIKTIRTRLGAGFYLWIYTNGDLVNEDKLRRLKKAGLDEIRYNISVRNYDLRRVEPAVDIINTVSVEIPVVAEDYEIMRRCLGKMQKIGIKHLNLHQLMTTTHNYKNFIKHGYTFLHQPTMPIFDSELVALKLIKYAVDNKISLPINYCSSAYKTRFQLKGRRERLGSLAKDDFEELTKSGFIRSISIQDTPENIKNINAVLQEADCQNNLWRLNDEKTEIVMHSSLLKYLNFSKYNYIVRYIESPSKVALGSDKGGKGIMLNINKEVFLKRNLVKQKHLSAIAMQCFQKLFIEGRSEKEALNYFYSHYNLNTRENLDEMKKEAESLISLKKWEHLESGFAELY